MLMMSSIYYFIGIFILMFVLSQIVNFNRIFNLIEWLDKFEKIKKKKPEKADFRSEDDLNLFFIRNTLLPVEGFWIIFGFITSNWFIFILMIIYGKIIGFIFNKIKYSIISKYLHLHFFILKSILYGFMIINHFHLKLDLYKIFLDMVK